MRSKKSARRSTNPRARRSSGPSTGSARRMGTASAWSRASISAKRLSMSAKWRNTLRMPTPAVSATCCAVGRSTPLPTSSKSACTIASRLRALRRCRPSVTDATPESLWIIRARGIELEQLVREEFQRLGLRRRYVHGMDPALATRLLPGPEPIADAIARPDQVHRVEQRVGHRGSRLCFPARQEEILDANSSLFVAEPLGEIVVEVLVACTHATDEERHPALHCHTRLLRLIGDNHGDAWQHRKVCEALAAAGLRESLLQVGQVRDVELLGIDHHREHAVGDLRRAAQSRRADRRCVDWDARIAVQDALERLAEPRGGRAPHRDLVLRAVELERFLAREDLADDRDVLA